MLQLEFAYCSDAGKTRGHNEDYVGQACPATATEAQSRGWLFAVADGVGGQQLGEVASRTAIDSVTANFKNSVGAESHSSLLRRLVQAANQKVYEAGAAASPGGVRIATTMVACALRYDQAVVAHVGDSRCYLVRNGQGAPLTRDHTVSSEQMRLGLITTREASESVNKRLLSRSLGNDLFVSVDIGEHRVVPGDVLLLCSDGLHHSVTGADMGRILGPQADLNQAALELVALANERDGGDNITVQLIRVLSVERMGIYRGRPYKLR